MDLSELRTAVRQRAHVRTDDGIWTDAFVDSAINEALTQISLEQPWWWLQAVATPTPTDGEVDLSAITPAVRDIAHVFVGRDEAKKVSVAETDLAGDEGSIDARYVWSVWGDTLTITADPTDTVTVRYYRDEPVLAATSDEPLMPEAYHGAIVEKACSIGFESIDDQSSAAMHEARSRALVQHMTSNALRRIRGRHSVRVRAGYPY